MNTYDLAKKNYDRGLWTKEMLNALVEKRLLGQAEYKEITDEESDK